MPSWNDSAANLPDREAALRDELNATGGSQTLAQILANGHSAAGSQINSLADPTSAQDAATKNYVDANSGGSNLGTYNVLSYGAKGDALQHADGAITSGAAVFTSASSSFSSLDIGKTIVVKGAGAAVGGHPAALQTTISSINSATSVNLAATASATVSGATFVYGTDDTTAIQAAIVAAHSAAVAAGGATRTLVVIPGGRTYITSYQQTRNTHYFDSLLIRSHVDIVGIGGPRLYVNQDGQHIASQIAKNVFGWDTVNEPSGAFNWSVKGLVIDGGFVSQQIASSPSPIAFPDATEDFFAFGLDQCYNFEVTDNYVSGIWGDAIRLGNNSCSDFQCSRNYLTLFNGQGINFSGTADRGVLDGNVLYDNQAVAGGSSEALVVQAGSGGGSTISNNVCVRAGTLGLVASVGGGPSSVTGNYIAPNPGGSGAIELQGKTISCTGNTCNLALYGPDLTNSTRGIYANSCSGLNITGNTVIMSSGARFSGAAGIQSSTGADVTISGNAIWASTPGTNGYDITVDGGAAVIVGNLCASIATGVSIQILGSTAGVGSIVRDNYCLAGAYIGNDTANLTRIVVSGNRFVGSSSSPVLNIRSGGNSFDNNVLDASACTGTGTSFAIEYGSGVGSSNRFRTNTIIGASAVNLQDAHAGYGFKDLFWGNIIEGGGVLNSLNASQFIAHTLTYNGTTWSEA